MTRIQPLAGHPPSWRREARASMALGLHLLLGQVALMLLPVMDVFSAAPLGADTVAAVGLVNSFMALFNLFCFGAMQAIAPLAGAVLGAGGGPAAARQVIGQGLQVATGIGALATLGMLLLAALAPGLGLSSSVAEQVRHYALALAPALLPAAWVAAWRVGEPVTGHARWLSLVLLGAAALHALGNRLAMSSMADVPVSPLTGLGWSYVLTYGAAALLLALRHGLARRRDTTAQALVPAESIRRLLAIGLPIGLVLAVEYTLFTGSTLLMGQHGGMALAAHTLALQWVSLAFVIPLALSHTVLTRLSLAIGRRDEAGVRQSIAVACAAALGFHLLLAGALLLAPGPLADLLLPEQSPGREALVLTAIPLLQVAALLQALNGLVVVLAAVLRACRDTRAPLGHIFTGYWLVGLGSAVLLGRTAGPAGIWWGMTLGFGLTVALLVRRVRRRLRHLEDIFPPMEVVHAQSR